MKKDISFLISQQWPAQFESVIHKKGNFIIMLVLSNTHNSTVYMEGYILIYGIFIVYSALKHNPPVYMGGNIMVYGIVCFTSNTIL